MGRRGVRVSGLLLAAFWGCAGPAVNLQQVPPAGVPLPVAGPSYRLVPGDALDVKFYYTPDLNESLTVRPDGFISLQLVGEVLAAGRTPGELAETLRKGYAERLPNPEVSVIVKSFSELQVYVGGEVAAPGTVPVHGRLTCAQALMERGGARASARLSQVLVLRHADPDSTLVFAVDVDAVLSGHARDLLLQPYDVVYVPRTAIAQVGQFVQQFINDIVPRSLSFPYSLNSHITVQ